MGPPFQNQNANPGLNLGDLGNAYNAGLSQSPYIYAQGQAGVYAKDDIVYVEAGGGENAAAAFVPPRAQYYPVDRPVPVKTKMRKSKRFWLILFLVLLIVVIIIAVGIGVGIHVADKSSDEGY